MAAAEEIRSTTAWHDAAGAHESFTRGEGTCDYGQRLKARALLSQGVNARAITEAVVGSVRTMMHELEQAQACNRRGLGLGPRVAHWCRIALNSHSGAYYTSQMRSSGDVR